MESYKSEPHNIECGISTVYEKLSHLDVFQNMIDTNRDKLPPEALENLDKVRIEGDAIVINSPMGDVRLVVDHEKCVDPNRIVYTAEQTPIEFNMAIDLQPVDDGNTQLVAAMELDLPFFLKGMVGSQLGMAAEKFGEMLSMIPYNRL